MTRTMRPTSPSTRSRISCAALLVNVIARISDGLAWPVATRCATRWVSTRVLPGPGAGQHQQRAARRARRPRAGAGSGARGAGPRATAGPREGSSRCRSRALRRACRRPTRRPGSGPGPGAADGPRRAAWCSLPGEVGDRALELPDPLGEAAQRVRDRVGQVQPVGVGALGLAALDAHRVARDADHGRVRRHVVDHDGVRADLRAVADRDRARAAWRPRRA